MKSKYGKLLLDLRWKAKAQKIKKRDRNKCTVCGSTKRLLVHHTYYYKNKVNPWEYPDKSLLTLCKSCHDDYHRHFENIYINKRKRQNTNNKPKKPVVQKEPEQLIHKNGCLYKKVKRHIGNEIKEVWRKY